MRKTMDIKQLLELVNDIDQGLITEECNLRVTNNKLVQVSSWNNKEYDVTVTNETTALKRFMIKHKLTLDHLETQGGEDEGSYFAVRYKVTQEDSNNIWYFAKEGYYQSHVGVDDWEECVQVEPREVTVTQFFQV